MVRMLAYRFTASLTISKSRALVLYSAMVAGFDSVHIRANLPRLQEALKLGESAGDRWAFRACQRFCC